ncbi:hypothetical protein X975_08324, partial [Stegodyphus mimosarum]
MIGKKNNCADINIHYAYAMQIIGMGYSAMKLFCGIIDLPHSVSKKAYNAAVKSLSCSSTVAQQSMKNAACEEVQHAFSSFNKNTS